MAEGNSAGIGFGQASPAGTRFGFAFEHLIAKGFAGYTCRGVDLLVTMRGTGMIDVFDHAGWRHAAFMDIDLQRPIHLDTAFGSPLIGLPFTAALRQAHGIALEGFDDLRRRHHYGFFVHPAYRNKGPKHVWNLDELIMAVALSHAENSGLGWFTVRPTGDTAPYYIRKYGAVRRPTSAAETVLSIPLGKARQPLPHVCRIGTTGRIHRLEVAMGLDHGRLPRPEENHV